MFKKLKKLLKKKPAKKPARKIKTAVRKSPARKPAAKAAKPIGVVTHYYTAIKVAIVRFKAPPKIGSKVRFHGATTDFAQAIASAQYDHKPVARIPRGKQVGIKVKSRVREGDAVYPEK